MRRHVARTLSHRCTGLIKPRVRMDWQEPEQLEQEVKPDAGSQNHDTDHVPNLNLGSSRMCDQRGTHYPGCTSTKRRTSSTRCINGFWNQPITHGQTCEWSKLHSILQDLCGHPHCPIFKPPLTPWSSKNHKSVIP